MGLAFSLVGFGALGGGPIAGRLLTSEYHWNRPIIFSGVCMFVCAALTFVSRCLVAKAKGTQRV